MHGSKPSAAASAVPPVPAETLFPMWRGRQPFATRASDVGKALRHASPGLAEAIAALPFDRFEAAHGPRAEVFSYNRMPADASALLASLPQGQQRDWLCALIVWHLGRFPQAFADTGLPAEFALHYADHFQRILDQIENDPQFGAVVNDSFLKDLWLTRAVMIPAFAQLWWPHSGIAARPLLKAGPLLWARFVVDCGGRAPFMEGHTHDPVAKDYWNEPGWGEALRLAALALPALPHLRGAFGSAWFYDPAIRTLSPRVAYTQAMQADRGAWQVKVGSNPDAINNATATSPSRREAYQAGTYLPTDYMMIWSRPNLLKAYG